MSQDNEQPAGQVSEVSNLTAEGQAPVTPEDTVADEVDKG